jgi:PadR family transcriptional regulator PadR
MDVEHAQADATVNLAVPTIEPTVAVLPRPHLEACLLLVLCEQPRHGYELMGEVARLGARAGDSATLYRALRRMEAEGLVRSRWETAARGPARRTYEVTELGEEWLRTAVLTLRHALSQLGALLGRYERSRGSSAEAVA